MTSGITTSHTLNRAPLFKSPFNISLQSGRFPCDVSYILVLVKLLFTPLSFPISTLIATIYFDHIYLPIAPLLVCFSFFNKELIMYPRVALNLQLSSTYKYVPLCLAFPILSLGMSLL